MVDALSQRLRRHRWNIERTLARLSATASASLRFLPSHVGLLEKPSE
ncbi:hypothetical protein [Rhodococcus ruber]